MKVLVREKLRMMGLAALVPCLFSFAQTPVGKGSYVTTGTFAVPTVTPYITPDFTQKVISAKWWSTLITTQFSQSMYAHPASYRASARGLEMGYPGAPGGSSGDFSSVHFASLTIGIQGMNAADTRVAGYSHCGVTARWKDSARTLNATMTQGLPFVYFTVAGGPAAVTFGFAPAVWYNQGGVIGVTVGGKHFGIFGPAGSTWSGTTILTSTLAGRDYLSAAVLPDSADATLLFFKNYAYSHVKALNVSWQYDESTALCTTTFTAVTEAKEGTERGTVFALLRHQWKNAPAPLTAYTYKSARGTMTVTTGQSFSTTMKFNGILVSMPDTGFAAATLQTQINAVSVPASAGAGSSTYNKDLGKYAQLVQIAEIAGNTGKRDALLQSLKSSLENWFTAGTNPQFYYCSPWNRLIGYPASYGSDTRLSDHHFHYGYFLRAATVVAQWDRAWAAKANWGGMVEMLIRDINTWDDNDSLFGRFSYFEPYEGHGWADGMGFDRGNNQESSSESMNFNAGAVLWGAMTGSRTIRDMGIFMYVNECQAIEQYWWDVDKAIFPVFFTHTAVGMVWSNGGAYATWFSANAGAVNGINILPNTSGHLYYGRHPDYILKNYAEGIAGNQWTDLFYEFSAYSDAAGALQRYNAGTSIEGGNSTPACYLEINSLNAVGRLDTVITGSTPTFGVFDKGAVRTYCAYNPDIVEKTVTFNDGFSLRVPALQQVCATGPVKPVAVKNAGPVKKQTHRVPAFLVTLDDNRRFPFFGTDAARVEIYSLTGKMVGTYMTGGGDIPQKAGRGVYLLKVKRLGDKK